MIQKTTDYTVFTFRPDNRRVIDQTHVQRLAHSITSRNLLELRPITVNAEMEILDGQHRLLAAKSLNIPIFYKIEKNLTAPDIILMNISKPWAIEDYLNFYCQHAYIEYQKLQDFAKNNNLSLKLAITLALGYQHVNFHEFRLGKFKFDANIQNEEIDICWDTINCIKKLNGYSAYTNTSKFWKSLLKLVKHPDFERSRWEVNLPKMVSTFCPKARTEDYIISLQYVYNWRSSQKINLLSE